MNKIWNWFIKSSADPKATSITVKGILIQYVGIAVLVLSGFDVQVSEPVLIEHIGAITTYLGVILSAFGLVRKIYFLFKPKS